MLLIFRDISRNGNARQLRLLVAYQVAALDFNFFFFYHIIILGSYRSVTTGGGGGGGGLVTLHSG